MSDKSDLSDHWKNKYYESLEAYEINEQQWARAEDLLRRTLSRLTLAADGVSPDLDVELQSLRSAIRNGIDTPSLGRNLESLSQTLVRLDETRGKPYSLTIPAVLSELLEKITWPHHVNNQVKALREQLANSSPHADFKNSLDLYSHLLRNALSTPESNSGTSGGFFHKLFRQKTEKPIIYPDELAIDSGTKRSAHEAFSVNEILIQLLERLTLPAEFDERIEALKDQLSAHLRSPDWAPILSQIAGFVSEMRSKIQQEKRDLELFLAQLTGRLQELDEHLQGAEMFRSESDLSGRELNQTVQEHMSTIQTTVAQASDLDQLKQAVQNRLEQIKQHMTGYRAAEEARQHQLQEEMRTLISRLHSMESEANTLRKRVREQRDQALKDALTGIYNRLAYDERIAEEYARWKRFKTPLSLMIFDVDNFKTINDSYGHKAGDKVLRIIADILSKQIRETDFIARYGGEEFIIVASGAGVMTARQLSDKLRISVEQHEFVHDGNPVKITISGGIAEFGKNSTPDSVFEQADHALYEAKQQGRNRCI